MLLTIAVILVVLWLLGVIIHVAGAFIHLLLLAGLILLIIHLVRANRHHSDV